VIEERAFCFFDARENGGCTHLNLVGGKRKNKIRRWTGILVEIIGREPVVCTSEAWMYRDSHCNHRS
jgi:hypothetical protein